MTWLSKGLKDLLNFTVEYLKHMSEFLRLVQNETGRGVSQHKIAKQGRLVPEMIYQIEQRDLTLLKVGKLCKGVDVSRWVRRFTARDFKIDTEKVSTLQEQEKERQKRKRKKEGASGTSKKTKAQTTTTQMEGDESDDTAENEDDSSSDEEAAEES
eukprot:CAMPEP_0117762380 /NCGR_PEP_ID=MMETSP0947-20121206/17903_1 /TAXON_ID=44440 /ORGANISM="Chattonella subsalsa, Strain CCMP2191" /LENGTH=155 /DNA_ID=CAMNT_0005583675 /DNA_START=101 /DNA_END=568 /DNA_ORIENTATION=+